MSQKDTKKLLLGICFFVLFISNSFGQVLNDYRTKASGLWSDFATVWERHNGTSWIAATASPTNTTANNVTILSTHTVTVAGATTIDQFNIASGGAVIINSAITLTIANGVTDLVISSGGTLTNNGTLTLNLSTASTNSGTLINSGTITTVGTLTHSATGLYQHNFPVSAATVGVIPTSTWNAASTCEILACGNTSSVPTGMTQTFGNFIWNNTTQTIDKNLLGTLTTIAGGFTINSTNGFNLNLVSTAAGGPTTVTGAFTLNSGNITILKVNAINKGNQLSVGSYVQSGGTMTIANCTGTFAGANSTNGQLTVSGTSTITGGTLNINVGSWVGSNGSGTFQSGGLITLSGTGTINGNSSTSLLSAGVAGTITATAGMTINAGGTLNLNTSTTTGSGGSTTFTSSGLITLSGGTISGSSGTTTGATGCNSTVQANAGFTMTSGTFNLTPGNIIGGGGTGFLNVTGALDVSGGTLNINSSTATAGTTGSNGTISVSTTCTFSGTAVVNATTSSTTGGGGNGTINVTGAFSMTAGTFNLCATSGTGTGNGLLDVGGNCSFTGGTFNITSSTTTAASVGTGTINVGGNFVHSTSAASFARTATSATAVAIITLDGLTALQTIRSDFGFTGTLITFNISQGGVAAARSTVPAATTFMVNSGTTFNVNDNSANITGDELQVLASTPIGLIVNGIMNVNSDATINLIGNVITGTGTFNLNSEATLITRHAQGITAIPAATGCVRVTTARNYNSSASYTYNGTAAQATGDGLPTSLTALSTLTINNSSATTTAGVTLTQATTTLGTFTLTAGRFITTAANLLTIGDGGICTSGGAITAFVDGPIKKIGFTAATPFIYPTGDVYTNSVPASAAKWARIAVTFPSTTTTEAFTAEYHKLNDPCATNQAVSNTNGPGIDHVSFKEYWDLTRTFGVATPTVKLYWEDNSQATSIGSAISSATTTDLHVAEFDGGQWNDRGAAGIVTAGITGNISTSIATTFTTGTIMPFTFSGPTAVNPLPVELLTFNGLSTIDGNQLFWSTASETNNDYFNLEKSFDGSEFSSIAIIEGNGNSISTKNYEHMDISPNAGLNYYRLKQVDYDGNFSYSNIISIQNDFNEPTIQVFPNPCQELVNITTSDNFSAIAIYNMLGELVFSSATSQNTIQFTPLAEGLYVVKATAKTGKEVITRFIKN